MSAYPKLVLSGVDHRDVEMDQEVVQTDRRDLVAKRFERHRVIARRQLQLVGRDLRRVDKCAGRSRL